MSKKLIIIIVTIACIIATIFYFINNTIGVYYKSFSPDGQYSRYASVNNYFSYGGPFAKFGDKSGKAFVYDEIEQKIVGSAQIDMISQIDYADWGIEFLSSKSGFSIKLPRKINSNLIAKYQKSFPVIYDWSLFIQGETYSVNEKKNRLTVKDKNEKIILKDIKYIAQINNDSVQMLNKKTEIVYLNKYLKAFNDTIKTIPTILEVCGNVSTYGLKIVENDTYYILKKAESFTDFNFDDYRSIDSINKANVKDIYFLNKKRELTYDGNFPKLELVIIDFGTYFGILDGKYGIQYFDTVDVTQFPIKVMRDGLFGYYNITPTKYLELHPFEFNLAEFKDAKNRTGYVDRFGNKYYKW